MAAAPVALILALALAQEAGGAAPGSRWAAGEAAPPPASGKEPAGELVRRCAAAYGGERARVRLARVRAVGRVSSELHPGEPGRLTRLFSRPGRLRLEVAFPGSAPEVQVLDGARAFRYGQPVTGTAALALQLQAARLELPMLLVEWDGRATDLGEIQHEGRPVRVLGLEVGPGLRLEVGIDPVTARIAYVRGLAQNGPSTLEVFTVFRDYKAVDGVLVAFREEGYANGQPTGDVDVEAVEFPEELPEEAFQP
ncbi:MAG TPA: hypothetical protein VMU15_03485 [Anaeromyxobacter sp.]|nr:hypothetical protein [Anaeromyxobacter sp.]